VIGVRRSADFSRDRRYRYALGRAWDDAKPTVLFVGLNPSTADHRVDDPTIRRCIRFAADWGFGRLLVGNLFAFRTPSPDVLRRAADPVGARNDLWLRRLAADADLTVAAWGNGGSFLARDRRACELLGSLHCLAITKQGSPQHPLYVRASALPRSLTA
jgi:hypothetical protein